MLHAPEISACCNQRMSQQQMPEGGEPDTYADVVVVGFGIAGGCAAVEAAAAGASVLVLERAAVAGGTTALAGGQDVRLPHGGDS
jgi:glycerol-3-phosphate dehydrogenase